MNNNRLPEVSTLIKSIRAKHGLTQKELAVRIGYTETYLSDVLSGNKKITDKFYNAIKNEFKKDFEETKTDSLDARIAQIQATLMTLQEDYIRLRAKIEQVPDTEIRDQLAVRTIQNLSKLVTSIYS